jgi:hypothetical protein
MDFGTALAYYTCVFEYKGGTYVRQFPKGFPGGIAQAVTNVLGFLESPVTDPAEQAGVDKCWRELVAIEDVQGVWYTALHIHSTLFEVLVIRQ